MSITCGFYNSINHDRTYNATQMSSIFDGIIADGIFQPIGDHFAVSALGTDMNVIVGSGRAWFNHTWTNNDTELPLEIDQAEVILSRIDSVVLEVNSEESVRNNTIKIIKGTPSSNPVPPTLTDTSTVHQYRLANVTIPSNAVAITQAMIENVIGTSETPFINGILETVNVDTLLMQWNAQFDEWFEHLHNELDQNQAGNLQNQIDNLSGTVEELALTEESHTFGVLSTSWVANEDTSTNGLPWVSNIESGLFSDDSKPDWEMISDLNANGIPAQTEMESINAIRFAIFSETGVTLYAVAKPTVNLKLYTKGV